jgi:signal peptidase II
VNVFIISCLVVLADQITKLMISRGFEPGQSVSIIGDTIRITFVTNTGAAFGMMRGGSTILLVFSVAVIIGVTIWLLRLKDPPAAKKVALALILGGALGNLVDRARLGRVVDFIDIGYGSIRWPAFNVADTSITAGALLLALAIFLEGRRRVYYS